MAAAYTKQFLLDAFYSRYADVLAKDSVEDRTRYMNMVEKHYDAVGKDRFRVYASLDADAIKKFKLESGRKS